MTYAGIDLGETCCRLATMPGTVAAEGPGAPGIADPGAVELAAAAIRHVLQAADVRSLEGVAVGAAGAHGAPEEARRLATTLADDLAVPVAVVSDAVAAHAGALGGRPGTVLAVGTGAVAVGLAADGRLAQVDGWGPWLGDDGGGAWIGREGLRAALAAREGRAPQTRLAAAARARFGELPLLPRSLRGDAGVARASATFVPDVLAAAESGDGPATAVLDAAVEHWVTAITTAAGAVGEEPVALVGRLAGAAYLGRRFAAALPAGLALQEPLGTSADGALLLAARADLPHEGAVVRASAGRSGGHGAVDRLATEQARADLRDLDERTPEELVGLLLQAEAYVPQALAAARRPLAEAVRCAAAALDAGGRIIYVGAGTPGRLAAQDAAECPPTYGISPDRVVAVIAGGSSAESRAVEGAEDDAGAGERDLMALGPGPADLVVGIAASGRTPYVCAALVAARRAGASTVAVANNPDSEIAAVADVAVEILTGPEVVAGSTRLKAGTAQKVALNVISTGAMVATGRTYGNWMVDVLATNDKLRFRARRILREAAGVDDAAALAALEAAGWRTKPALVALLAGVDPEAAAAALERHGGRVRRALADLRPLR